MLLEDHQAGNQAGENDRRPGKGCEDSRADVRFVQNFTLPDIQATTFTQSILHYFNSFGDKTQKSE